MLKENWDKFFKKRYKVGFEKFTKKDYGDYHTAWETTLTGISGIDTKISKLENSTSTPFSIKNALTGISNVVSTTTSDLKRLDPLKLQELAATFADLKAKRDELQKLI